MLQALCNLPAVQGVSAGSMASSRGDRHWQQTCPERRAVHALHAEPASTPTWRAAPGMAGMPCLSARLMDE